MCVREREREIDCLVFIHCCVVGFLSIYYACDLHSVLFPTKVGRGTDTLILGVWFAEHANAQDNLEYDIAKLLVSHRS